MREGSNRDADRRAACGRLRQGNPAALRPASWRRGWWVLAGLAAGMTCAALPALAAQDKSKSPPSPAGADKSRDPKAAEANRRALEERDRLTREQAQRQADEAAQRMREAGVGAPGIPAMGAGGVPGVPGVEEAAGAGGAPVAPPPEPVPADQLGALEGETGMVKLNFTEPVDLGAFVEYVAKALKVNFHTDPQMQGKTVTFKAPIAVPADQLLPLLSRLLEEQGLALVREDLGWYSVVQPGNIPPLLDEHELRTTKVIPTPLVKPSALDAPIKAQLGTAGQSLRMTAIDEIGALIVTAPARQITIIERLIEEIMAGLADQKLHRIALRHVASDYARERVITLNGRLGVGGGGAAVAPAQPGQPSPIGGAAGALTSLDQRLIADQGNALIFRGRDDEVERVRELVAMVDAVTPLTAKRYTVGSAAAQVAEQGGRMGLGPVLSSASSGTSALGGFSGRPVQSRVGVSGAAAAASEVATSGFTVDEDSGTIIYFGTDEQHRLVEQLVKNFNEQALATRIEIQMYKLKHAKAESVVQVLDSLVQGGRTGTSPFLPRGASGRSGSSRETRGARDPNLGPRPGEEPAAAATAATGADAGAGGGGDSLSLSFTPEEISIVEDTDRNQVLVKAPARQQREIARIIERLDQRLPQVYLEVQIVSITTTDDFNWTVESQISAGDFLIFSNFGLTGVPTNGDAQSPRTVPANRRGLTSAIIDEKYTPFVIRTLQENTNGRLISSPRVLVNDNQEATIESTREEPFQSTSQNANTTITGQGGTATAGTTLTVTPQISGGGYLSLDYEIELSSFEGLPRTDGLQRPKQQERYQSSVTVPSDSTIVVGGFTLDQQSESDARIPILGDIPVIGNLFKDYTRNKRRTTIYVFITPTIMTDPNFLDLRLTTDGPKQVAKIEGETPPLEPVVIPITTREVLRTRQLPRNEAALRGPE